MTSHIECDWFRHSWLLTNEAHFTIRNWGHVLHDKCVYSMINHTECDRLSIPSNLTNDQWDLLPDKWLGSPTPGEVRTIFWQTARIESMIDSIELENWPVKCIPWHLTKETYSMKSRADLLSNDLLSRGPYSLSKCPVLCPKRHIYLNIYVCTHTCMHICMFVDVHVCMYIYVYIHDNNKNTTHVCTCIRMYVHICIHTQW